MAPPSPLASGLPLKSAMKNDEDGDKTPPLSGLSKGLCALNHVANSPIDVYTLDHGNEACGECVLDWH